jgi:hypothetical protein
MKKQYCLLLAAWVMMLLLSACSLPKSLPPKVTPTLVADVMATFTPAPTRTPTQSPTPLPTSTPTPAATPTPTPTPTPAATPTPATIRLELTEAKANALAREKIATKTDIPLKDMRIDFRPDAIYLSGNAKVGFFYTNVVIAFAVQAQEGKPQITVQEILIAGMPASGSMKKRIEDMIIPHLDDLALVSDNFYAEDIRLTDDKMITTGYYR